MVLRRSILLAGVMALLLVSGCHPGANPPTGRLANETATPPGMVCTAAFIPASAGFPLTVTDDLGVKMTFDTAPQRIVSLAPSLTELLFALGIGDRVVGVTDYCQYPPEALKKPKVGGYINSSQEKIVSLAPDVVFATRGTPQTFMQSLRESGIRVFAVDQTSLEQVTSRMISIGHICGCRAQAETLAATISEPLQQAAKQVAALPSAQKPRVLFAVQLDLVFVAGTGSYQDDILKACGAINVAQTDKPFAPLSSEIVVTADPQVLVLTSDQLGKLTREQMLTQLKASATWGHVSAVREGRLIVLPTDHISIPGPRLASGIRELARQLHPELCKDL